MFRFDLINALQKALLERNAKVYILGRSSEQFDKALERLASEGITNKPRFIACDLSSRTSPLQAAKELSSKESSLNILFCNAGVMVPPVGSKTEEGYDLQWATNVMGHWILTTALLPLLLHAADNGGEKARVVHTSSSGHRFAPRGTVDWESLQPEGDKRLGNWVLYGQVRRRCFFLFLLCSTSPR